MVIPIREEATGSSALAEVADPTGLQNVEGFGEVAGASYILGQRI
jgi:hypothetical protein